MKLSIFNNRVRLSENTDILFNSYTEESQIIHRTFKLCVENLNESVKDIFTEKGFLVDDNINEVQRIRDSFEHSYSTTQSFKLTINPTLNCNFRCWYCYETHKPESTMKQDCVASIMKCIERLSEEYPSLELSFFGGEPFLQYENIIKPLIDHTHKVFSQKGKRYIVTFTSNGYLINQDMINELSRYNIGISQITLDGGPEFLNNTRISSDGQSFEKIIENIGKLSDASFPVLIRINVTKENISSASDIVKYIQNFSDRKKSLIRVLVQQV